MAARKKADAICIVSPAIMYLLRAMHWMTMERMILRSIFTLKYIFRSKHIIENINYQDPNIPLLILIKLQLVSIITNPVTPHYASGSPGGPGYLLRRISPHQIGLFFHIITIFNKFLESWQNANNLNLSQMLLVAGAPLVNITTVSQKISGVCQTP